MDPATYKLLHYIGIIFLMLGLGAAFNAARDGGKLYAIAHGIGALLLLVSGFGMQAKMRDVYIQAYDTSFPWWILLKVIIWVLLGASITVLKRRLLPPAVSWILILLLACVAVYFGHAHSKF